MAKGNVIVRLKRLFGSEKDTKDSLLSFAEEIDRLDAVKTVQRLTPSIFEKINITIGQPIDFKVIYALLGVKDDERFNAEQVLEILQELPPDLPTEVKWKSVRIALRLALRSVGKSDREIVQDAEEKATALESCVSSLRKEFEDLTEEANKKIADLQSQIEGWQRLIEAKRQKMEYITKGCNERIKQLKDVLSFFVPLNGRLEREAINK